MKTPPEEAAEISARIQHLKTKIVALTRQARDAGINPDQFQIDQINGELLILQARLDVLNTLFG